jgi:hypothetical protein
MYGSEGLLVFHPPKFLSRRLRLVQAPSPGGYPRVCWVKGLSCRTVPRSDHKSPEFPHFSALMVLVCRGCRLATPGARVPGMRKAHSDVVVSCRRLVHPIGHEEGHDRVSERSVHGSQVPPKVRLSSPLRGPDGARLACRAACCRQVPVRAYQAAVDTGHSQVSHRHRLVRRQCSWRPHHRLLHAWRACGPPGDGAHPLGRNLLTEIGVRRRAELRVFRREAHGVDEAPAAHHIR